jgi:protease-4
MPLDTDSMIDRRRLKKRLAIWRIVALGAVFGMIVAAIGRAPQLTPEDHVAVLWVEGMIFSDPYREDAIRALIDDDSVSALIVQIDSPGGTTFGSEALYHALDEVRAVKPVVAVMNGVAASGGYMAAVATDYIVARESTITGSIGVIMEATNFVGLMEKLGIENNSIKSGPLKAEPNPLSPLTPEARAAAAAVVGEVHEMFVDMVAAGRGMPRDEAARLADGRIYTGTKANEVGLIDAIGGEAEALAWLESEHELDPELPLIEIEIEYPERLVDRLISSVMGKPYLTERLRLDGLMSLWHPLLAD